MNKVYSRIQWENEPSKNTPLNESNLNKMDYSLNEIDNRVVSMDTSKANKTDLDNLVNSWVMDKDTGVITITKVSGEQIIFDLNIEKIPVSFSLSDDGILTMVTDDGTVFSANIGAMIPILTFENSDTIIVSVSGSGINKIYSFSVKNGSITEDKLQPNYLADIKVEVAKAQSSQQAAALSETNVKESETAAKASENAAATSATNAKISETNAKTSETNSKSSETAAKTSQTAAKTSETNALESANTATTKAGEASTSASNASASAANAATSASTASTKANEASASATQSQNYATGDTDSAKYYYEQAKTISESFAGALRPIGTVTFANLPSLSSVTAGDMYNISNQFTTTSDFKEGAGNVIPAGSNVYKTTDGKWDVLAGSPVTGVKGSAETTYRRGNVDITPANIGLGKVGNFKAVSTVASQELTDVEKTNARTNIGAGTSSFSGSYNDLSNKPTIPAAVAVKGNAETSYRTGNVNITPANLGITVVNNTADADKSVKYATSAGSANSATKATQDGNGNNIVNTYLAKTGDSANNVTTFTSGDAASPTAWTNVAVLASKEKHSSILNKISTMFKNVRYLYKMLGTTDISSVGGGTVTGAISALNRNLMSTWENLYSGVVPGGAANVTWSNGRKISDYRMIAVYYYMNDAYKPCMGGNMIAASLFKKFNTTQKPFGFSGYISSRIYALASYSSDTTAFLQCNGFIEVYGIK